MYYKDAILAGSKIEHNNEVYEIKHVINKGGFSFIYDADMIIYGGQSNIVRRELFRQNIILKELYIEGHSRREDGFQLSWHDENKENSLSAKIKFKTISEAQKLQNLSSPNIIEILSAFEKNNTVYLATKKIQNAQDLGTIININDEKNSRPLSLEKALKYIHQIAEALKVVHEKNILHLDIKPDNILIDESDNAILIDFGISISIDDHRKTTLLGARTPHYSPPEQGSKISFNSISYATDIYALGCTLYVLLTGKLVPDFSEIVAGTAVILAPSNFNKKISSYLDDVIFKSISLKKEERFPNLDEFIYALKNENEYNSLLAEAKELLQNNEFSKAAEKLNSTTKIIPFTKEAIELNKQIAISFEKHKAYEELRKIKLEAEELIQKGELETALQLYNKIPENHEIAELKTKLKHEIKNQNIEKLKQLAKEYEFKEQYNKALETYIQLKKLLNTEIEIDQKINAIQDILLKDEQYSYFIKKADLYFNEKQYELAIIEYTKAKNLNINISYIDNQIKICEKEIVIAEEKERESQLQKRYIQYLKAIEKGDNLVEEGKYEAAIIEYNFAKTLIEDSTEAENKIKFCNKEIEAEQKKEENKVKREQEKIYQKIVENGDQFFIKGLYEEALKEYQQAKALQTDTYEVDQKILLCEKKIAARKEKEKEIIKEKNYLIEKIKKSRFENFERVQKEVLLFLEKHNDDELTLILKTATFQYLYQKAEILLNNKEYNKSYEILKDLENQPIKEVLRRQIEKLKSILEKQLKETSQNANTNTIINEKTNEKPKENNNETKLVEAPTNPYQTINENEQKMKITNAHSLFLENKIKDAIDLLKTIPEKSKFFEEAQKLLLQYHQPDGVTNETSLVEDICREIDYILKANKVHQSEIKKALAKAKILKEFPNQTSKASEYTKLLEEKLNVALSRSKKKATTILIGIGLLIITTITAVFLITNKTKSKNEISFIDPGLGSLTPEQNNVINKEQENSKSAVNTINVPPANVNNGENGAGQENKKSNLIDDASKKEKILSQKNEEQINQLKENKVQEKEKENNTKVTDHKNIESLKGDLVLNGHLYKGDILNGKANGNGILTFQKTDIVSKDDPNSQQAEKGDYIKGRWREGRLEFGTLFNNKGEKKATIVIGRY